MNSGCVTRSSKSTAGCNAVMGSPVESKQDGCRQNTVDMKGDEEPGRMNSG